MSVMCQNIFRKETLHVWIILPPISFSLLREGQSEVASGSTGGAPGGSVTSRGGISYSREQVLHNLTVIKTGHVSPYSAVTLHRIQHSRFAFSQDIFLGFWLTG